MHPVARRLSFAQGASGSIGGGYTPWFGAFLAFKGLLPDQISALLATGMLVRVLIAPATGVIADARNDRRGMMLALYVLMLAGYGALNGIDSVWLIFAAAIPANLAGGAITPLLESASMRLSERFHFDYGHVRVWASSSFVAANLLSGALVSRYGVGILAPWLTVTAALGLISVYFLPRPPTQEYQSSFIARARTTLQEAGELIRSKTFLLFLAAASFDQASHAMYYAFGGFHMHRIGYSGWVVGILWPLGVLGEILLMSYSLPVFRALGATRLLFLGGLGCVVRWSLLAFDPPLPFIVLAQFLHGATFAMAHLGAMYFILKAVPPRLAATAQSLYAVCWSGIGLGLATLACGPLYAAYGGRTYLLMAAMGLIASLLALWLGRIWQGGRLTAHGADGDLGDVI